MLVPRDRLLHVPLMSLQTGIEVGRTTEPIIDPRRLNIVAFYCTGPHIEFQPAVIHASDIRELSNLGMIIDSAESIMQPEDLVRLKEVLDFHFTLDGKQVIEEGGYKIGKVIDFTVESDTLYISKLHVKPTLWRSLSAAEFLIDRSQIKTINDKQVVVKRADIGTRVSAETKPLPVIENPFKPHPQTETMGQPK
jgi:sporulation protein YlmC with PRC-barrel domain